MKRNFNNNFLNIVKKYLYMANRGGSKGFYYIGNTCDRQN